MIFLLSINCINLSINANINAPNIIIKSALYPLHRNEHGGVCIIDLNGLACTHNSKQLDTVLWGQFIGMTKEERVKGSALDNMIKILDSSHSHIHIHTQFLVSPLDIGHCCAKRKV